MFELIYNFILSAIVNIKNYFASFSTWFKQTFNSTPPPKNEIMDFVEQSLKKMHESKCTAEDKKKLEAIASIFGTPNDLEFLPSSLAPFLNGVQNFKKTGKLYEEFLFSPIIKKYLTKNNINDVIIHPAYNYSANTAGLLTEDETLYKGKIVIIPINLNNNHWNMAVLDLRDDNSKNMYYFEPLGGDKRSDTTDKIKTHFNIADIYHNSIGAQFDGTECGPFSLQFSLQFVSDLSRQNITALHNNMEDDNLTRYLFSSITDSNNTELPRNFSTSLSAGEKFREFHIELANEAIQDILSVLNKSEEKSTSPRRREA